VPDGCLLVSSTARPTKLRHALSNFVADAVNVVGFDPFGRLVDYMEPGARG
jgi:hypothetical protein